MKVTELLEAGLLGQGMSKAARAADVEQSDREYIAQRQRKEKWKAERLKGCKCPGPRKDQVNPHCPIHGVAEDKKTDRVDAKLAKLTAKVHAPVKALVDELWKARNIVDISMNGADTIDLSTRKGDNVTLIHQGNGTFFAWVQGQKNDIDVGDVGSSAKDILEFLKGINKAWYREYDEHFDEALDHSDEPLTESFWAITNKYRLSDDPRKDSKNGEDFLSLSGDYMHKGVKDSGARSIEALDNLLQASGGEVTDEVLAWNGSASIRKWLKWVKENGRKVKKASGRYVG